MHEELINRLNRVIDTTRSVQDRMRNRSHLTNRDLRTCVAALQAPVYVPGVFRCAKCGFRLIQKTLNAQDGSVAMRDAPGDKCPNDGSPMWRVSYQEELAEAEKIAEQQHERAVAAEGQLLQLRGLASGEIVSMTLGDQGTEETAASFRDGWRSAMHLVRGLLGSESHTSSTA